MASGVRESRTGERNFLSECVAAFRAGVDAARNSRHKRTVISPTVADTRPNHGPLTRSPTMQTAYQLALDEFKEASAAVRNAFTLQAEARSAQIIANRNYDTASVAYLAAQDRLSRADDALTMVKEGDASTATVMLGKFGVPGSVGIPAGQGVDQQTAEPVNPRPHALFGVPFNQMFNGSPATPVDDEPSAYPHRAE